jgi:eukaryotic-like serine/threonine-protein kinase
MSLQPEMYVRNYIIKDLIARGGMGIVWRAWDQSRNEFVAIKAVVNDLLADPNFKHRFLDEMRRHARLNDPNIVSVLDVFEVDGESCFVMKLIKGMSLADLLEGRKHHRLETREAISIVHDILSGLDYSHRQGIIHRDIKPSNILLDENNRAHLTDFGIALAVGEQRRTRTGQILGTPLYMSPEQIVRPKSIDHRSDVYSVGCVLYEMLTGRPPFLPHTHEAGDTDFAIRKAHVTEVPVPPKQLLATIPAAINKVIMWALEKDPEKRLPGCQEFLKLLSQGAASDKGSSEAGRTISTILNGIIKRLGSNLSLGLVYLLIFVIAYAVLLFIFRRLFNI